MTKEASIYDCLVIGGGPAGLTAAEYLGRFLRKTLVVDSGSSRAALIPRTHNYPGFDNGISGVDFLGKLRKQVTDTKVHIRSDEILSLRRERQGYFEAVGHHITVLSKNIILATGMIDEKPTLPNIAEFIYDGIVRFCPICDGYEAMDKKVGIIGPRSRLYQKACFLRTYTKQVELFPLDDDYGYDPENRERLLSLGVSIPEKKIIDIKLNEQGATGIFEDESMKDVDFLYPAMGAKVRTGFVKDMDLRMNDTGCVYTDRHQQTNVEGIYAIGDITLDLSQIAVATGQAAIAATAIHNSLPVNCRNS